MVIVNYTIIYKVYGIRPFSKISWLKHFIKHFMCNNIVIRFPKSPTYPKT
ncbi:hypothetical protein Hanom_Chr14g01248641 [Helianthus anomalus]